MFRTPTGQTGKDAYVFEAAAIANEMRELTARFQALREVVLEEMPELMPHRSDFAFSDAGAAGKFLEHIQRGCQCTRCKRSREA